MTTSTQSQLAKFSNLEALNGALRDVETKHLGNVPSGDEALLGARNDVILAIQHAHLSRYKLGKALAGYRTYFKAKRGWIDATEAIADALRCKSRTVRNVVADYEHISGLPDVVIDAAEFRGIDLARRRYLPAVKTIEAKLNPDEDLNSDQAEELLDNAIHQPRNEESEDDRFVALTKDEKARWKIRIKIRTGLNNFEPRRKLTELMAALEEEMFDVWGETDEVMVLITPRPSPMTLDGRKKRDPECTKQG